jgi:hypothetical protein
MTSSALYFRMHHGTQSEILNFIGNEIRLLDLKREIMIVKGHRTNKFDFDYSITDESSGKEYSEDDDVVPKNSSLIVRRRPAKKENSLTFRLEGRRSFLTSSR